VPSPADPLPVTPRHSQVIDGAHVELRWAPTHDADAYLVQISEDGAFDDVVFQEEVAGESAALTVRRQFPEHGRRFYWRVLARSDGDWSPGEHIESFTSGTVTDEFTADPDLTEPVGPMPGLFKTAFLQGLAEVTPGRQPAAEEAVGGTPEGLEGAEIVSLGMTFIVAVALVLGVIILLTFYAC
jgi:hypothetical protein